MRTFLLFATLSAGLLSGSSFTAVPADGNRTGNSGDIVGWGYSIENSTSLWLVPMGLSSSGVLFGTLVDIYDYGVVAPLATSSLPYLFGAPGGPGFSAGLFEYLIPAAAPAGSLQNGTFTLQYQYFSDNPDTNPLAVPVGEILSFADTPFAVTVASASVPEPGSLTLVLLGIGGVLVRGPRQRWRRSLTRSGDGE